VKCFVQLGFVPYMIITLLVRQHVSLTNDLLIEALILLVDPLFGLFAGLGHIAEVFQLYISL